MLIESRATTAPGLGSSFFAGSSLPRSRKNQAAPAISASRSGTAMSSFFVDFLAPSSPAAAPAAPAPAVAAVRVGVDIVRSWIWLGMGVSQGRELGGDLGHERAHRRRLVAHEDDVDPPVEPDGSLVVAGIQGTRGAVPGGRQPLGR